jgi:hypothetical protein
MNYIEINQAIQSYSENTESLFVENIPTFVKEAEKRIYNSVQLPSLRKNVTGAMAANNKYVALPNDWLSTYSIAVIDSTGRYEYLLNKDVNFIRQSYPTPTSTGLPRYYSIFGSQVSEINEMSIILGPTPDSTYTMELHYFYYPESIVQGTITGLGTINGGSGYTDGTYYNVPFSGGSGSGATATVVISSGIVTQVTISNPGSFYAIGDSITIASSYIGISGSAFSTTVTNISNANGTSWLGDNYDPVLFYGAMREAVIFMKGEQDMVTYYEKMFQDALGQLKRLGDGLERGDAYRDGQTKLRVTT